MGLLKTSRDGKGRGKGKRGHEHVIYVSDDGQGMAEVSAGIDGHTHPVEFVDGQIVVGPSGDGHDHTVIGDFYPVDLPVEKTKLQKGLQGEELGKSHVKQSLELWKEAVNADKENIKGADRAQKYMHGDQWNKTVKDKLSNDNRAALTYNMLKPKLLTLSGVQRQNRTMPDAIPVEGGDQIACDILNPLINNVCHQNRYKYTETEWFINQSAYGRGFVHIYLDTDSNLEGDVKIDSYGYKDAWLGPHTKLDGSDAEYCAFSKMWTKDKIIQTWPGSKEKIENAFKLGGDGESGNVEAEGYDPRFYFTSDADKNSLTFAGQSMIDLGKKTMRVLQVNRKVYRTKYIIMSLDGEEVGSYTDLSQEEMDMIQSLQGVRIIKRNSNVIQSTVMAGSVPLDTSILRYPNGKHVTDLHLIPAYGFKDGDYWTGKIMDGADAQDEINKRRSQVADIMNKAVRNGWFFDAETFSNPQEEEKFKRSSSSAGFMAKVADSSRPPVAVEGANIPHQLYNILGMESQTLDLMMGINEELQGAGKADSGVLFNDRIRQSLTGNEYLFDNLDLSKERCFTLVAKMIINTYDTDRILRVLGQMAQGDEPVEIEGQKFDPHNQEMVMAVNTRLKDPNLFKYDIVMSQKGYSETQKRANLMTLQELARHGVPVDPISIIEHMDMPKKDKTGVINRIIAMQQAEAENEKRKTDMELIKVQEANKSKLAQEVLKSELNKKNSDK